MSGKAAAKVATFELSNGKRIPVMGWGGGSGKQFNGGQHTEDMALYALKAGLRHLDTAQVYNTEKQIGEAVRKSGIPRNEIWVTSKCNSTIPISSSSKTKITPEDVKRSVNQSISALGFIPDLYLLHNPFLHESSPGAEKKTIADLYTLVEDLVLDGTLKDCSLGLSNFRPVDIEQVMSVARIKPVVNQIEYHPYLLVAYDDLTPVHDKYGIIIQSYGGLSPLLKHPTGGPILKPLQRVASSRNIDTQQALYLWTISKGVNIITSSGNPKNIDKMAEVDHMPRLSEKEVEEIDKAGRLCHWRNQKEHMVRDRPVPDLPQDV